MSDAGPSPTPTRLSDVTVKLLFIVCLVLLLLIPRFFVSSLIDEREQYRDGAVKTITGRWGGSQQIGGPVLVIPFDVVWRDAKNGTVRSRRELIVLPDELSVSAIVQPEKRSHGIYDVVVYSAKVVLAGTFGRRGGVSAMLPAGSEVRWNEAAIHVGIEDPRGLREAVAMIWNGKSIPMESAAKAPRWSSAAVMARVPVAQEGGEAKFLCSLSLNGSESLLVVPVGGSTRVRMQAPWRRPFFTGAFLPGESSLTPAGFEATWQVTRLARGYPQAWVDDDVKGEVVKASALGTDFPDPVDVYFVSQRAVKHALLFLTLTFSTFFLFEALAGLALHPVQYFLVGAANVLFYLLLIAFSEHLRFGLAYSVAVLGIAGMVTGYSRSILGDWRRASVIAGLMAALYAWLYVVLMLEDHALLLGAVGLFAALASFMYLTRHINWASPGAPVSPPAGELPGGPGVRTTRSGGSGPVRGSRAG